MRRVALIALGSCALVACASPAPAAPTTTPLPTLTPAPARPTAAPVVVQPVAPQAGPRSPVRPTASPIPASLPLSLLAGRSGADLRVALDVLFSEDAFFTSMAMQAGTAARLDEQIALTAALDQNAATLAGVVGALKGSSAGQTLLDNWRTQTAAVVQGRSVEAASEAVAVDLASGDFTRESAAALLQRRLQDEQALAASVRSADSAATAQRLSNLLTASDELARPLASAMAAQLPDQLPGRPDGADVDVRVHLDGALTAHVLLSAAAMEAAADGRVAEAQAYASTAAAADNALGFQLDQALAPDLGSLVASRLQAQTSALLSAAQQHDRSQAASDLDRLRGEIDGLISAANPLLAPGLLRQQLRASDQPLLSGADAFAARDFSSGFARVHEAVRQVQKPATTLALALVDRYPARYLAVPTPRPYSGRRATTT